MLLIFPCVQEALKEEIKSLESRVTSIQEVLGDLKVQLYAKFGNNINLEADESWMLQYLDHLTNWHQFPIWILHPDVVDDFAALIVGSVLYGRLCLCT